jgi:putative transposase
MSIKRPLLVNNEIYHIILRGVADSVIFKDRNDYYRGVFSLYEFNDINPVLIRDRRRARLRAKKEGREQFSANRDMFVEILTFYFMPNHIHLLLRQIKNDGITQFMKKFGTGYAVYFNKKYNRKGHLFQGRFRAVHIKTNEQLRTVFVYIHTNGVSLLEPKWKEKGIINLKKVIKFLENYKWSSYADYLSKKNFPSLTKRGFLLKVMGGKKGCREFVNGWIEYKKELGDFNKIALE